MPDNFSHDDDLVMESTTDSAEQIAAGLGVEAPEVPDPAEETPADDAAPAVEAGAAEDAVDEEPIVEDVTPEPERGVASRKPRAQRKSVDGAAAAARRSASARTKALEEENAALRARLAMPGATDARPDGLPRPAATPPPATVRVAPESIPDTHPAIAPLVAKITALGAKPKQADFDDFDTFEDARDTWIEDRARLRARVDTVREDVARQDTITLSEADRAAQQTADRFKQTVTDARSRHEDYDAVMDRARAADLEVSRDLQLAMGESPLGGELAYYLASHPEEARRLATLRPHRQVVELGMLENRLQQALPELAPRAGERPRARITRAPDPQRTVLGDGPSAVRPKDLNDPNLTQAEYNRARDRMDVESGRRIH